MVKISKFIFRLIAKKIYLPKYYNSLGYQNSVYRDYWTYRDVMNRLIFRQNAYVPWPVGINVAINTWQNIEFDPDDIHIFQTPGCYFQAQDAKIIIGKGTWVAPNVGIITTNHDVKNPSQHVSGKDVKIGSNCWIGMNAVILPGVILGNNTVVAAGAVVTKSFTVGNCVIAGVPARIITIMDTNLPSKI